MVKTAAIFIYLCSAFPTFCSPAELEEDKLLQMVKKYIEGGELHAAAEIFERVLQLKINVSPYFYFLYGETLFNLKSYNRAIEILTIYIERSDENGPRYPQALGYVKKIEIELSKVWVIEREEQFYNGKFRGYSTYTTDNRGNITRKELYDEKNNLYEYILYAYNPEGDLLREIKKKVSPEGEVSTAYRNEYTFTRGVLRVEKVYYKHILWITKKYNEYGDQIFFHTDSIRGSDRVIETVVSEYTYDDKGKKIKRIKERTVMKNMTSENSTSVFHYEYNDDGELIKVTGPENTTQYEYRNGLCIREYNSSGWETLYTYNLEGQILRKETSRPDRSSIVENFLYDQYGNLIKHEIIDPQRLYESIVKKWTYAEKK
jgi:tetratricopeptide (TPR) repeat protein